MKRMKKIIASALALMMILPTLTVLVPAATAADADSGSTTATVPAAIDFNGDGKTDIADVVLMLRHLMNPAKYPWSYSHDFNGDGRETVADATHFLKYMLFGYSINIDCPGHNYVNGVCTVCGHVNGAACIDEHNFVDNVCTNCGERGSAGLAYKVYSPTSGEYAMVTGIGTCTDTDIIIPQTYKGVSVTRVGSSSFANNTTITSVELPETITNIYSKAFYGCSSLTAIKYSGTKAQWAAVGFGVSWNCDTSISKIVCSDGEITVLPCEVGEHEFVDNVCAYCGERGSAGLIYSTSGQVTGIGTCTDTEVIIPKTYMGTPVTGISGNAFKGNTSVTSVEMQDGMQKIYSQAFYGCTALTSVSVPDSITYIVNSAFDGCTNLQFNVYDNAKYLGNAENKYVLLYEASTTSVSSCEIHEDTKVINCYAFQNCKKLASATIPNGVVCLSDYVFQNCSQLTEMKIPSSVTSIGTATFADCLNMATLTVDEDNKYYCAVDGILYNKAMTEIIAAAPDAVVGTVEILDSVQTINNYAFSGCSKITSVKFGENSNLKRISSHAFYDCTSLESINIPSSVTSIDYTAFRNCLKLTEITVDDANKYYSADGAVMFNKDKTTIRLVSGALTGKYVIPESVTKIDGYAFAFSNVSSVVIHDGITEITARAFVSCYDLKSVYIGKGVTSIGSAAFQADSNIEYIYYAGTEAEWAAITKGSGWNNGLNSCSVICSDTVIDCTNSAHDYVDNVCTRCGERGSAGLEYSLGNRYDSSTGSDVPYAYVTGIGTCADTDIIIAKTYKGKDVTCVGVSAFENNTSITSVELPETITNIYYGSFYGCSALTAVFIPGSLTSIGFDAFNGCSALTTINFAGTKEQWNAIKLGGRWKTNSAITTIICSDGEIKDYPCNTAEHNFVNNVCTYCGERGSVGLTYSTGSKYDSSTDSRVYCAWVDGIGTCTDMEIVIPKTYKGKTVFLWNSAFADNTVITSVELPETTTEIANQAFYGCAALTTIKYAGTKAQWNTITFGSNWDYNSGISEIICSDGVICYQHDFVDNACTRCGERGSAGLVYINGSSYTPASGQIHYSGMTVLGWGTCTDTEVIIPQTYHGQQVVAVSISGENTNVTSIEFQDGMQVIGNLGTCSALTDISVPDSVIRVQNAFNKCANLEYTIENNVKYLGNKDNPYFVLVGLVDTSVSSVEINGKTRVIAKSAFKGCSLTTVDLPVGLKSIGSNAFDSCKLLSEIQIPNSVERIDEYAFEWCVSLTSIEIPASVTEISGGLLGMCTALTDVTVAADNPNYCAQSGMIFTKDMKTLIAASGGLSGEIVIPDTVETLYNGAFYGCDQLTAVKFGDESQLKKICAYAFEYCKCLVSINIPSKFENFDGKCIFRYCYNLTDITVADDNLNFSADGMVIFNKDKTSIELVSGALTGKYIIPNTVTSIGDAAFCNSDISSVVIPNSVVKIGRYSFEFCRNMTTVYMGKGVTNIGYGAFDFCNLTTINYAGTEEEWAAIKKTSGWDNYTGDYTVYYSKDIYDGICLTEGHNFVNNVCEYCGERGSAGLAYSVGDSGVVTLSGIGTCTDTEVVIPKTYLGKTVTAIGANAFVKNTNIVSVILQDGLETIGSSAFASCTALKSITLPESLTAIPNYCFRSCAALESVELPANLIKIGTYAFDGCKSLTNIAIPENITSIPNYCFYNCWALESVTLPSAVVSIGDYAFYGCKALVEITLPSSLTTMGSGKGYTFSGCASLTSIEIPEGITAIPNSCFGKCTTLTDVIIPSTVVSVGSDAFYFCPLNLNIKDGACYLGNSKDPYRVLVSVADDSVTEVVVPGDVIIASRAFANSSVESIVISEGITNIPQYAFAGATKLRSLTLPASVSAIGTYAFMNTTALTDVVISEDNSSFRYVDGIIYNRDLDTVVVAVGSIAGDIVIPASVTNISKYAFYRCSMLTGVSFDEGSKLTTIETNAFNSCTSLVSFKLPENISSISATAINNCTSLTEITVDAENPYIAAVGLAIVSADDHTRMIGTVNSTQTIVIPDSVTTVAKGALSSAVKGETIYVGANVTTIESRVFGSLKGTVTINYTGTKEQWQAINLASDWAYSGKKYAVKVVCADGTLSYTM